MLTRDLFVEANLLVKASRTCDKWGSRKSKKSVAQLLNGPWG